MPEFQVRPFRRADGDQITKLVAVHAGAVMPGAAASVEAVQNQFEREPEQFVVGSWIGDRQCIVAQQDDTIVAAALLVRYRADADVGASYRNAGEVRWLLFWPMAPAGNPYCNDGHAAAQGVLDTCLAQLQHWRVSRQYADGTLPVPGLYGVPDQWPHIADLYAANGFVPALDCTHIIQLADLADLPEPGDPPLRGLSLNRQVGINGTRLVACLDQTPIGSIEIEILDRDANSRLADIGSFEVVADYQGQNVGTWLLRHAASWLRLGHVDRLLHRADIGDTIRLAYVEHNGFREITRTRRGWERPATG